MNNKDAMEKNFSLFIFINSGINLSSINLKLDILNKLKG